jgi:hypothetical protein
MRKFDSGVAALMDIIQKNLPQCLDMLKTTGSPGENPEVSSNSRRVAHALPGNNFKAVLRKLYEENLSKCAETEAAAPAPVEKTSDQPSLQSIDMAHLKPGERERLRKILFTFWNPGGDEKSRASAFSANDETLRKATRIFNQIYFDRNSCTIDKKTAGAFEFLESGQKLIDYRDPSGENPFAEKSAGGMLLYEKVRKSGIAAMTTEQDTLGLDVNVASEVLRSQGYAGAGARLSQCHDAIEKAAQAHKVDPYLITAVIAQESGFNARAQSCCGAQGLMQLMPGTASEQGVNDPFNPLQNVMGGTRYLSRLLGTFNNTQKALAAYNAGPGNVQKYNGIPPFRETRDYVANISSLYRSFKERVSRGLGKLSAGK